MLESPFHKVTGQKPVTLLKKRFQHRCFPVNFVKFLRTPFREHIRATASGKPLSTADPEISGCLLIQILLSFDV